MCRKFRNDSNTPVADKQGRLITSKAEQDKRWAEHIQEVLNQTEPALAKAESRGLQLNILLETPTLSKNEEAIKTLKNRKAPEPDMLCPEMFNADPKYSANILMRLFESTWRCKKVPADWKKGIIVKIPKNGKRTDCNNWCGITLLPVPRKILAKIIYKRICTTVDNHLRQEQAGFQKHRGCVDHIFAMRNIIEQCAEWQRRIYINFIDFSKAFDSVHREMLWKYSSLMVYLRAS